MDRRLTKVFVDEQKRATTAAYEVVIPDGILAEEESSDSESEGGGPSGRGGMARVGRTRSTTHRIFSVAEVLKWNLEEESIKEIHYFGSGVRLSTSRIKGKLHRARQHRKRHGDGEEDELEMELGAFDNQLSSSGKPNIGKVQSQLSSLSLFR